MIYLITIVDTISPTSMPVNEFVIYRSRHNYEIQQSLFVCDSTTPCGVEIPPDVTIKITTNKRDMRLALKQAIQICKDEKKDLIIHLHHQKSALLFFRSSKRLGIKNRVLFTIHSTYSGRDFKYKLSSSLCVLKAKYANCVSNSAYYGYSKFIRKIKSNRLVSIQNGVDVDRLNNALGGSNPTNKYTLMCVGRMIPLKNHIFLLKVLKLLPDVFKLILIGKEDPEQTIRSEAQAMGLSGRVTFLGVLPRDEVYHHLNDARYYLSPSFVEGFPVSVLEAAGKGLIPLLSDIGPHKEISLVNDYIYSLPLNEVLWANTILEISKLNDKTIESIQKSIAIATQKSFSLPVMHSKYFDLYKRMIDDN